MRRIFNFRAQRPAGFKAWLAIVVTLIISIAALSVVAILAVGAFLVFVPILLFLIVAYAILPQRRARERSQSAPREAEIIDGEYRVVDSSENDQNSLSKKD